MHRYLSLALGLVVPAVARANGGPVDWTEAGARGGVFPLEERDVALESEDLVLRIDDDGKHYEARAVYRLANGAGEKRVLYGIPVAAPDDSGGGENKTLSSAEVDAIARSVSVTVGGAKAPACKLATAKGLVAPPLPEAEPGMITLEAARGWCVTTVSLPAGPSTLELRYRAALVYEDAAVSKSALPSFATRILRYPLFPAGFWKGTPRTLTIHLEAGRYARDVTVKSPAGVHADGTAFTWRLETPDLKGLLALVADVRPRLLEQAALQAALKPHHRDGKGLKASSTLAAQGRSTYGPAQMTDGQLATAWCEGVEGDGVGQWVEVDGLGTKSQGGGGPGCRLEGIVIVPGYAKSAATWRANGRVRTVKVSPCGKSEPSMSFTLETAPDLADAPAQLIKLGGPDAEEQLEATCLRFEIVEVTAGEKFHDTCISELAPLYNCM